MESELLFFRDTSYFIWTLIDHLIASTRVALLNELTWMAWRKLPGRKNLIFPFSHRLFLQFRFLTGRTNKSMNLTRKKKQTELLLLGWYTWFMKERVERPTIASNGITSNFLAALVLGLSEPPLLKILYRWRPCYVSNDWSTTAMLFIYS